MNRTLPVLVRTSTSIATAAERTDVLWREARQAASDHTSELLDAMATTRRLAAEIAQGSDAYPPALRDLARRLADHLGAQSDTMDVVTRGRL